MKLLIITLFIIFSYNVKASDPLVLQVISSQKPTCRSFNARNCIKPVNTPGTSIKAIEIQVFSTEKVTFTTYDSNGVPINMEKDFSLRISADRERSLIDADIEINATAPEELLKMTCLKNNFLSCNYYAHRLLDKYKTAEASKILKKNCLLNFIPACQLILDHPGLSINKEMRLLSLKQLCKLNQYHYCSQLGADLISENKGHEVIFELLEGCKQGEQSSCILSALVFYKENAIEAVRALAAGCNLIRGASTCYLLGSILFLDNKKEDSIPFFKAGCDKGNTQSCSNKPPKDINLLLGDILKQENIMGNLKIK